MKNVIAGLALFIMAAAVSFGAVGCQTPTEECGPTNCTGCCANSLCYSGNTNSKRCGQDGDSCMACSSDERCVDGSCVTGSGVCNATTCPSGCCLQGACLVGTNPAACGFGGAACTTCGTGQGCVANACSNVACGPTSCPSGCCDLSGQCAVGTNQTACGTGGSACTACTETQFCSSGFCTANPVCNSTTCPTGCCDSLGKCVTTTTNAACGKGGQACLVCSSNQGCGTDKTCTCTPSSCPNGCCNGNTCVVGTTVGACGKGGAACKACTGQEKCGAGVCTLTCDPSTCTGCCSGTTCLDGDTLSACGQWGAACTKCAGGDTCKNGTCNNTTQCFNPPGKCCKGGKEFVGTSDTLCGTDGDFCQNCGPDAGCDNVGGVWGCYYKDTYKWSLVLVSASFKATTKWDGFLANPAPDVHVKVILGGNIGESSTIDNSYTPQWNELMFTAQASDFYAGQLMITVKDYDTFGSDAMTNPSTITRPVTVADLNTRGFDISDGAEVLHLVFQLVPVGP